MNNVRNFAVFNVYLNRSLTAEFGGALSEGEITFITTSFAHLFLMNNKSATLAIIQLRELCNAMSEAGEMDPIPEQVFNILTCHGTGMFNSAYRNTSEGDDLHEL